MRCPVSLGAGAPNVGKDDLRGVPILSARLGGLANPDRKWRPTGTTSGIGGVGTRFEFPICKLLDFTDAELESAPNPVTGHSTGCRRPHGRWPRTASAGHCRRSTSRTLVARVDPRPSGRRPGSAHPPGAPIRWLRPRWEGGRWVAPPGHGSSGKDPRDPRCRSTDRGTCRSTRWTRTRAPGSPPGAGLAP